MGGMSGVSEYAKWESESMGGMSGVSEYAKCESGCMGGMSGVSEYAKWESESVDSFVLSFCCLLSINLFFAWGSRKISLHSPSEKI